MNDKLVYSFTEYLRLQFSYDDNEIAKIKYSLEAFLYEFEKLVILLIIFSLLGKTHEFIISTIVLFTIRPIAGGLHFSKFINCFLFTLIFFVLAIIILPLIPLKKTTIIIILFVSLIINYLFSPISSKNRPNKDYKTNTKFKLLSSIIILVHSTIILYFKNINVLSCYIWIIALQSVQLIISKEMLNYEKKI